MAAAEKNPRRLPRAVSLAVVLLMAAVGLTDAAGTHAAVEAIKKTELPVFTLGEPSAWEALQAQARGDRESTDPEAIETREYDLAEAIAKVDDTPEDMSAKDWLLVWCKLSHLKMTDVKTDPEDPQRVTITMSRRGHRFFKQMLAEVCRAGHVDQITVTTRVMSSEQVEKLVKADWMGTIKYAAPEPISSSQWEKSVSQEDGPEFSLSMEAVSFEYTPYTAFIVNDERIRKIFRYFVSNREASITSASKVTLFSGQSALITDESLTPFVYGVQSIKGEYAEALQPIITVIPEGLKVDLQAFTLDDDTVDLRCRLTLSSLDGVTEATLPGADVTVQTPKATRRTVNVRCRLSSGETLLVAPIAGQRSDGKKTHYYAISAEQIFQDEQIED